MKNMKAHIVLVLLAVFVVVGCTKSSDKQVRVEVESEKTTTIKETKGDSDILVKAKPVGSVVKSSTVVAEEELSAGESVPLNTIKSRLSSKKEGDRVGRKVDYAGAEVDSVEAMVRLKVVENNRVRAQVAAEAKAQYEASRRYIGIAPMPMPTPIPIKAHGGTATVNDAPYAAEFYENYGVNPFVDADEDNLSTFAIDVDTASYANARRYILGGNLPPRAAVRAEEFINYFDYGYASKGGSSNGGAFDIYTEGAPSKFSRSASLLRIGVKGFEIDNENRKDATLTFVIDVSGSMAREDRLGLVKKSLRLLVDELTEHDKVAIVIYGSRGRVIMDHRRLDDKDTILRAIDSLRPEGATNAEEGLKIGYELAAKAYEKGRINRVILCSDGVANVGRTSAESILSEVKAYADKGITLSSIGFGMGNFNDVMLEKLGDKGNGHYAYVDTLDEARRIFVENLTGTLQVIAGDVKVQVDFNPTVVRSYRLIGYENRDVADNKFRDDKEDGGEIGSGHSVTALYEVKFWKGEEARSGGYNNDDEGGRRYNKNRRYSGGDGVATVYVRYKDPATGKVQEVAKSIAQSDFRASFDDASDSLKLAAGVAEFAEILKENHWSKGSSFDGVLDVLHSIGGDLKNDKDVIELLHLVSKAREIDKRRVN